MIKDFRILPRAAGKTTLAMQQACKPDSVVIVPTHSRKRDFLGCNVATIHDLPVINKFSTLIFDELDDFYHTGQHFIALNHERYDIYIYTSPISRYSPEFHALLTKTYPELLL